MKVPAIVPKFAFHVVPLDQPMAEASGAMKAEITYFKRNVAPAIAQAAGVNIRSTPVRSRHNLQGFGSRLRQDAYARARAVVPQMASNALELSEVLAIGRSVADLVGKALTQMDAPPKSRTPPFCRTDLPVEALREADGFREVEGFLAERTRAAWTKTRTNAEWLRHDTLGVARFPSVQLARLGDNAGQYFYQPSINTIFLNGEEMFFRRKPVRDHGRELLDPRDFVAHTTLHEMLHWFVARFAWSEVPPFKSPTNDVLHNAFTWGRLATFFLGAASSA